jgi:hypothetical protein
MPEDPFVLFTRVGRDVGTIAARNTVPPTCGGHSELPPGELTSGNGSSQPALGNATIRVTVAGIDFGSPPHAGGGCARYGYGHST